MATSQPQRRKNKRKGKRKNKKNIIKVLKNYQFYQTHFYPKNKNLLPNAFKNSKIILENRIKRKIHFLEKIISKNRMIIKCFYLVIRIFLKMS